jgi:type III secretory pathway component EscV
MKRTLIVEASVRSEWDTEASATYDELPPGMRTAILDRMRDNLAEWFAENTDAGAIITVDVRVEEAEDDA